jgi:hypothetical protein
MQRAHPACGRLLLKLSRERVNVRCRGEDLGDDLWVKNISTRETDAEATEY